jgi:excisionase family DNA binding protein
LDNPSHLFFHGAEGLLKQCAQLLKVSTRTIYELISNNKEPDKIFANKVGRSWHILRSEVDNFLLREKGSSYQMKRSIPVTKPIKVINLLTK